MRVGGYRRTPRLAPMMLFRRAGGIRCATTTAAGCAAGRCAGCIQPRAGSAAAAADEAVRQGCEARKVAELECSCFGRRCCAASRWRGAQSRRHNARAQIQAVRGTGYRRTRISSDRLRSEGRSASTSSRSDEQAGDRRDQFLRPAPSGRTLTAPGRAGRSPR